MKKTIAVIDDDIDMRDGLTAWLSEEYHVASFASAEQFLKNPDVMQTCRCLLLDLRMPGMSGAALQERLIQSGFLAPIVFMSGDAQQADIIAAWRSGAFDFILKPFTPSDVSDALRKVFSAIDLKATHPEPTSLSISRREAQVLLLLGEGLQQQEIANRLGLSLRTIKMYRAFLKNKLNLNSLIEIGKFCDRHRDMIAKHAEQWSLDSR